MTPLGWGLIAAFASGLAWSGLDIARKTLSRDAPVTVVAAGLSVGLAVLFGGAALIAPGSMDMTRYWGPGAISIVLSTAVQVLIVASVQRSELSRTIPLLSLTPVATSIFGVVILGEQQSALQWAGSRSCSSARWAWACLAWSRPAVANRNASAWMRERS